MLKFTLYLILFFLNPKILLAEEISTFTFSGSNFFISLPDKYCDVSKSEVGNFYLDYLNKAKAKNMLMPLPKIVLYPCNKKVDFDYPWGYVGIRKSSNLIKTQLDLNKQMAKLFGNKNLLNKLSKIREKINKEIINEYGFDSDFNTLNKPKILWTDNNTVIFQIINSGYLEGEKFTEIVVASSTLLKNVIITTYITNEFNRSTNIKEIVLRLANYSKTIKKFNK